MPTIETLPTATSVTPDDLVPIVDDPSGVGVTQHARLSDILSLAVAELAGVAWRGIYNGTVAYAAKDVVSYNGNVYIALNPVAANSGDLPTDATNWQLWVAQGPVGDTGAVGADGPTGNDGLPKAWRGPWSAGTYIAGDAVTYNNAAWVTPLGTSAIPGNSPWILILSQPWKTLVVPWAANTIYSALSPADVVFYNGSSYVCINSHTSGTSFDSTKWQMVAAQGPIGPVGIIESVTTVDPVRNTSSDPANPQISLREDGGAGAVVTTDLYGFVPRPMLGNAVQVLALGPTDYNLQDNAGPRGSVYWMHKWNSTGNLLSPGLPAKPSGFQYQPNSGSLFNNSPYFSPTACNIASIKIPPLDNVTQAVYLSCVANLTFDSIQGGGWVAWFRRESFTPDPVFGCALTQVSAVCSVGPGWPLPATIPPDPEAPLYIAGFDLSGTVPYQPGTGPGPLGEWEYQVWYWSGYTHTTLQLGPIRPTVALYGEGITSFSVTALSMLRQM